MVRSGAAITSLGAKGEGPNSYFWLGPDLAVETIWEVNCKMEDLCVSLCVSFCLHINKQVFNSYMAAQQRNPPACSTGVPFGATSSPSCSTSDPTSCLLRVWENGGDGSNPWSLYPHGRLGQQLPFSSS